MPKIDVSAIEGYKDMTPEEKISLLEGYEFAVPEDTESTKLKNALSKANSEAADWKRKFRETQSEAERQAAERAEQDASLQAELEALRKDKAVSGYKAKYLEVGYSSELAEKAAAAMADGDHATVFDSLKTFLEKKTEEIKAAALKSQPDLSAGKAPSEKTAEELNHEKLRRYAGLK